MPSREKFRNLLYYPPKTDPRETNFSGHCPVSDSETARGTTPQLIPKALRFGERVAQSEIVNHLKEAQERRENPSLNSLL